MVKELFNRLAVGGGASEVGVSIAAISQSVIMGNLTPEAVSISGVAVIDQARNSQRQEQEKKKEREEFLREAEQVRRYLEYLDTQIAETQERIALLEVDRIEARRRAQQAFDDAHEAEDLLHAISDGVTTEERKRVVKLLGLEAAISSKEELGVLLENYTATKEAVGREQSELADELDERIEEERQKLQELKNAREAYEKAQSTEERAEIEQRYANVTLNEKEGEPEQSVNLDFDGLGLP